MQLNNNPNFRSITPNEYVPGGTLVWTERSSHGNEPIVEGPFIIHEGWGPIWFGSANGNKRDTSQRVELIDPNGGDIEHVTWGSFLFTSFYVINEEESCIDVEIK